MVKSVKHYVKINGIKRNRLSIISKTMRVIKVALFLLTLYICYKFWAGSGSIDQLLERSEDAVSLPPTPTVMWKAPSFNLPPSSLTHSTGLYASPNRSELISPITIPAGETIYVIGRNATSSHLRVVFDTSVGWIPVSFTDYNGRPEKLKILPILRDPPACAEPVATQFGMHNTWTSDREQRIAIVVDLFRSRYGNFPSSSLSLTVNGREVEKTKRQIVEQGQFSLKGIIFTLPDRIREGDVLGYLLDTTSNESMVFIATIFRIPEGCKWDVR